MAYFGETPPDYPYRGRFLFCGGGRMLAMGHFRVQPAHGVMSEKSFDELIDHLRRRLGDGLPGHPAHRRMLPTPAEDPNRALLQGRDCREAAVLAALLPESDGAAILLTARQGGLAQHAGQISFPGGRREPDEPLAETALREAHEEVGLEPEDVELLGELTPLYIPPSNFCVYPFVGFVRASPPLAPYAPEVERILRVPLSELLDPENVRSEPWTVRGRRLVVPHFRLGGLTIWGATAMMLAELLEVIRSA